MGTAIVIGVGPDAGLGAQLCKRFAADGLHVLVAGRTRAALDAVVADIVASGGRATAVVADATSEANIVALFDKAGADLELAIYNAGNNTAGKIIDMTAEYFEQSWRVVCFGGFLFGREAVRRMVPKGAGTLLLKEVTKLPLDAQVRLLEALDVGFARIEDREAARKREEWAKTEVGKLTEREKEVLEGLACGYPNKTIAYDLGISPRTVEIYRANVMTKMQAGSLSELVRMAMIAGILDGGPKTS